MKRILDVFCVSNCPQSIATFSVACLLTLLGVQMFNKASAIDDSESLSLVVETINAELDNPDVCAALMRGMLSGLEGRRNVTSPPGWSELSERLASSKNERVRQLSLNLSQLFGDREATQRAISLLKDRAADESKRRTALYSLLDQQNEEAADLLESLLDEPSLALDAIRGYAIVARDSAPQVLLDRYQKFSPTLRSAAIETLATRENYAEALLAALEQARVSREDIPAHVARSLSLVLGARFTKAFGEVQQIAADREQLIAKYKSMITPEAIAIADASRGRAVFNKTCAVCHQLYGEGGNVGPDLTGSNRANLDYILLNSVDPSYDVPDAYKMVQILTVNGRLISGVLAEEDAVRVVLKTAEQPRVVVAKDDIETRRVSPKSMMPDGQLDQMKPEEVIDLIKYLRTTTQVETAK